MEIHSDYLYLFSWQKNHFGKHFTNFTRMKAPERKIFQMFDTTITFDTKSYVKLLSFLFVEITNSV